MTTHDTQRGADGGAEHPACNDCGRADGLEAVMTDEQWQAIMGRSDGGGTLCLWCIDKRAKERGLQFPVSLYFVGEAVESVLPRGADGEGRVEAERAFMDQHTKPCPECHGPCVALVYERGEISLGVFPAVKREEHDAAIARLEAAERVVTKALVAVDLLLIRYAGTGHYQCVVCRDSGIGTDFLHAESCPVAEIRGILAATHTTEDT